MGYTYTFDMPPPEVHIMSRLYFVLRFVATRWVRVSTIHDLKVASLRSFINDAGISAVNLG